MRAMTASNTAAVLYADDREGIAQQILEEVRRQVAPRGIIVENVLLRDLQLPDAKVIVVGNAKNGLPLIYAGEK